MDSLGPYLLLRLRTIGHRLFYPFGLYVAVSSPYLALNSTMHFCHQGIAQRIKFVLFLSLPSSLLLYSTPP